MKKNNSLYEKKIDPEFILKNNKIVFNDIKNITEDIFSNGT